MQQPFSLLYTAAHVVAACRLEGVLYSLTSCSAELLQLRRPALPDLQYTCAWASQACTKPSASKATTASKHAEGNEAPEQNGDISRAASM